MQNNEGKLDSFVEAVSLAIPTHARQAPTVYYTCILGPHADVRVATGILSPGIALVVFTDQELDCEYSATIVKVPPLLGISPRRVGKIFKMLPHRLFDSAQTAIYIDSNISLAPSILALVASLSFRDHALYVFRHNRRRSTVEELMYCWYVGKIGFTRVLLDFIWLLSSAARRSPLIQGGFIIRRLDDCAVNARFESWYALTAIRSDRDQLYMPYALAPLLHSGKMAFLAGRLHESEHITIHPHRLPDFRNDGTAYRRFNIAAVISPIRELFRRSRSE